MKFPENLRLNKIPGYPSERGDPFGWFVAPVCTLLPRGLKMMACDGTETGWEHLSVSHLTNDVTPTWEEMCLAKGLFWDDSECVVQFHPPAADAVNIHKGCLHLWRKVGESFPMPPQACV